MYQVSDACKQALNAPVQTHSLRGLCAGRTFTRHDVIKDSFRINKQMCDATAVKLGGVYIGQLQMTFSNKYATQRGGWMGKVITPEIGILVGEEFEWIPCPSGSYTIHDAVWTADGLEIVAYDNMSKFDKNINLSTSSGSAYDFLNSACRICGVELGMSREEIETFPNGNEILGLYPTDSVVTWRDMLGWLAQALCSFATIDRNGALILVEFPSKYDGYTEIKKNQRYTGASFSDFDSYFTQITVTDIEEGTSKNYIIGTNDGLSMNLGANPFLQYGTEETKDSMRSAILSSLKDFFFAPFSASTLLNPTYDLGDCIQFVGGIAKGCTCTVMSLTMTLDTVMLDGFGDNPALQDVLSTTDKEINSVTGSQNSKKLVYFTYSNVSDLDIGSTPEVITDVKFVTTSETTVIIWCEIDGDVLLSNSAATVQFTYYLDDEEITYHPTHTIGENGKHLIHLNYYLLNLESDKIHRFVIEMKANGGRVQVPIDNIHFSLSGQGLIQENTWDGKISVSDTFGLLLKGSMPVPFVDSGTDVIFRTPMPAVATDVFSLGLSGGLSIGFRDEKNIILEEPTYRIATTEGDLLVTTDGDFMET